MESLVEKERLEDGELIQIPENVVRLQVVMGSIKQYKNLLQSEKRNSVNIAYRQGCILRKFKESKEFINRVQKQPPEVLKNLFLKISQNSQAPVPEPLF